MTLLPSQVADKMSAMTIEAQTTPQKHAAMTPRVTALLDSVGGGCGVVGGVVTAAQIIARRIFNRQIKISLKTLSMFFEIAYLYLYNKTLMYSYRE